MPIKIKMESSKSKDENIESFEISDQNYKKMVELWGIRANYTIEQKIIPQNLANDLHDHLGQAIYNDRKLKILFQAFCDYQIVSSNSTLMSNNSAIIKTIGNLQYQLSQLEEAESLTDENLITLLESMVKLKVESMNSKEYDTSLDNQEKTAYEQQLKVLRPTDSNDSAPKTDPKFLSDSYSEYALDPFSYWINDPEKLVPFIKRFSKQILKANLTLDIKRFDPQADARALHEIISESSSPKKPIPEKTSLQKIMMAIFQFFNAFFYKSSNKKDVTNDSDSSDTTQENVSPTPSNQLNNAPGDSSIEHGNEAGSSPTSSRFPSKDSSDWGVTDGEDSDDGHSHNSTKKKR